MITEHIFYQCQKLEEKRLTKYYDGRFVAMFHQVSDEVGCWYDKRYAITFSSFRQFVLQLMETGFEIVSPYALFCSGKRQVVLSFDDVFDGVFYQVYPFLRQLNVPFVIFPAICKLKEPGYINEEMVKQIVSEYSGGVLGAHGISHNNMRQLAYAECRKEILESGDLLQKITGKQVDFFAYPYGSYNAVGKREQKIADGRYKMAFGTLQTGLSAKMNPMYVPRININEENYIDIIENMKRT